MSKKMTEGKAAARGNAEAAARRWDFTTEEIPAKPQKVCSAGLGRQGKIQQPV